MEEKIFQIILFFSHLIVFLQRDASSLRLKPLILNFFKPLKPFKPLKLVKIKVRSLVVVNVIVEI